MMMTQPNGCGRQASN